MRSGTKYLKISSIILIILGAVSLIGTWLLIGKGDVSAAGMSAEKALLILVLTYCGQIFQIIAGIIGLAKADKKSLLTVVLGVLLFIPQLIMFLHAKDSYAMITVNVILLAIPYYYLSGAYKNYKA